MATPRTPVNGEMLITPDPALPLFQILFQRDRKEGVVGMFFSEDGGKNFLPLVPLPTEHVKPGATPVLGKDRKVRWEQPAIPKASSAAINAPFFITESYSGLLALNGVFGYFQVPPGNSYECLGIQASLQTAADGVVKLDLIDVNAAAQNKVLTVAPGKTGAAITFKQALYMPENSLWRFKILQTGSAAAPGEFLQMRMVLRRKA